jgi:hypothetical protein
LFGPPGKKACKISPVEEVARQKRFELLTPDSELGFHNDPISGQVDGRAQSGLQIAPNPLIHGS